MSTQQYPANRLSDEEYFAADKNRGGRACVIRMIQKGTLFQCAECNLPPEWNGKPLSLQVDHIDGNRFNSVFENLRLLCPNCHAQTETFGKPKAAVSGGKAQYGYCFCGAKMLLTSQNCVPCANKVLGLRDLESGVRTTIEYPSIEELTKMLQAAGSWAVVSEQLGVSHNAMKKYYKARGLLLSDIPYQRKIRYNKSSNTS